MRISPITPFGKTAVSALPFVGLLILAGGGCSAPLAVSGDVRPARLPDRAPAAAIQAAPESAGELPSSADAAPDAGALAGVADKLEQVRELDPQAAPLLLAELQKTPPKFWPAAAEQFRASLAYHQQLVAKKGRAPNSIDETPLIADSPDAAAEGRASVASSAAAGALADQDVVQTDFASAGRSAEALAEPDSALAGGAAQPPVLDIHPSSLKLAEHDWHELLEMSADDLGGRVAATPASTAEIHQHATLRVLRLLSGQTEQALEPIPGIAPHEQDYWSRQLFALATYLDHHSQPDDKRRAAATALHLDEGLAHLRHIGSLSLRNLAFCRTVSGYGSYTPYDSTRFSAGQQVALYVEVENYRSRSTAEGFCTSLGSSYEVLDEAGERVDGGDFPDVDDCCRSRRRDFHIQYGLTLPATLAPGKYRLQLILRDRQSDKIGSAAAAFEVVGARSQESKIESPK
jgi:hypothetical protein